MTDLVGNSATSATYGERAAFSQPATFENILADH